MGRAPIKFDEFCTKPCRIVYFHSILVNQQLSILSHTVIYSHLRKYMNMWHEVTESMPGLRAHIKVQHIPLLGLRLVMSGVPDQVAHATPIVVDEREGHQGARRVHQDGGAHPVNHRHKVAMHGQRTSADHGCVNRGVSSLAPCQLCL